MKGIRYSLLCLLYITVALTLPQDAVASGTWQAPFDTATAAAESTDSVLSLGDALRLAAAKNPTLKSLGFERVAAEAQLEQAGLWPNPEFGLEFEEIGWDAPGFKESEITLSIVQGFDLFGRRGARKQLARVEIDATEFHTRVAAFDLYREVKRRFYTLAHAQQHLDLSRISVRLATDIVENINFRIEKGAAPQSELLLAQLEMQRTELALERAQHEKMAAEATLAALWDGQPGGVNVTTESEPDLANLMRQVASLEPKMDSTRTVMQLTRQSAIVRAERSLAVAEARPEITLSGGVKRLEGPNSNSFVIGVSLPLPLFNRNQGTRESLEARLRSLDHQIVRERLDMASAIETHSIRLRELMHRHDTLDSLLLPTAEDAYETLRRIYEAGRLPYTQLLEAERSLNELRFEQNDVLLAIHEQIIALEGLTGISLRTDKEN